MSHVLHMFWHGRALDPYENLSITSFLQNGYQVDVYTYDRDLVIPASANLRDAREILPEDQVTYYASGPEIGSVSLFANLFRYELLLKKGGWWADVDMICLRQYDQPGETFFARQDANLVNNAIMRFPASHPVMLACAKLAREGIGLAEWGDIGPHLLTKVLTEQDLIKEAADPLIAYPIEYSRWTDLFDANKRDKIARISRNGFFLHYWNEMWRRAGVNKQLRPPQGSFLDNLIENLQIEFPKGPRLELAPLKAAAEISEQFSGVRQTFINDR